MILEGDTVEVTNARYSNMGDIPDNEKSRLEYTGEPAVFVGSRFIVDFVRSDGMIGVKYKNRLGKFDSIIIADSEKDVKLCKRPTINWINVLLKKNGCRV